MKKVILISGYKNSGKDFVAELLQKQIVDSEVLAFATPMKDIISTMFGISKSTLDEYKNNEDVIYVNDHHSCPTWVSKLTDFRVIIQKFGSEAMKPVFGDDVWTDLMVENIHQLKCEYIIVSDWRFINEYQGINDSYEVVTVRVDDHNLSAGEHDSEHQLDNFQFDYNLNNTDKDDTIKPQVNALANLILQEVI